MSSQHPQRHQLSVIRKNALNSTSPCPTSSSSQQKKRRTKGAFGVHNEIRQNRQMSPLQDLVFDPNKENIYDGSRLQKPSSRSAANTPDIVKAPKAPKAENSSLRPRISLDKEGAVVNEDVLMRKRVEKIWAEKEDLRFEKESLEKLVTTLRTELEKSKIDANRAVNKMKKDIFSQMMTQHNQFETDILELTSQNEKTHSKIKILAGEKDAAVGRIRQLQDEKEKVKTELEKISQQNKVLKCEVEKTTSDLEEKLQQKEEDLSVLLEEQEEYEREIQEIGKKYGESWRSRQLAIATIKELQSQVDETKARLIEVAAEKDFMKETIKELSENEVRLTKELEKSKKEKEELGKKYGESWRSGQITIATIKDLQRQLDECKVSLIEVTKEKEHEQQKVKELSENEAKAGELVAKLSREYEHSEKEREELGKRYGKSWRSRQLALVNISQLKSQVDETKSSLCDEIAVLLEEKEDANKENEELGKKYGESWRSRQLALANNKELQNQLDNAHTAHCKLANSNKELQGQISSLRSEVNSARRDITTLTDKNHMLSQTVQGHNKKQEDAANTIKHLTDEVGVKEDEIKALRAEKEQLEAASSDLEVRLEKAEENAAKLTKEQEEQKQEHDELGKKFGESWRAGQLALANIKELQSQVDLKEDEIKALRAEKEQLEAASSDLEVRLEKAEENVAKLTKEQEEQKQEHDELGKKFGESWRAGQLALANIKELQSHADEARSQLRQLMKEKELKEHEIKELSEREVKAGEALFELKTINDELNACIKELEEKIKKISSEKDAIEDRALNHKVEVDLAQEKITALTKKNHILNQTVQDLHKRQENATYTISNLTGVVDLKEDEIKALRAEKDQLKVASSDLEMCLQKAEKTASELAEKKQSITRDLNDLISKKEELFLAAKELQIEVDKNRSQLCQLTKDKEDRDQKIKELSEKEVETGKILTELKTANDEGLKIKERLKEQLEKATNKNEAKETELARLLTELDEIKHELHTARTEKNELDLICSNLVDEKSLLRENSTKLEEDVEAFVKEKERVEKCMVDLTALNDSMKKKNSYLSTKLQTKAEEVKELSKNYECLKSKVTELEKEKDKSTTVAVNLEAACEASQQQIKNLETELGSLRSLNHAQLSEHKKERDLFNERISDLDSRRSDLERELKAQKNEIEKVNVEKKVISDRFDEVMKSNKDSIDQIASLTSEKEKALEQKAALASDRNKALSQIQSLHDCLESHSKSIESLNARSSVLVKENEKYTAETKNLKESLEAVKQQLEDERAKVDKLSAEKIFTEQCLDDLRKKDLSMNQELNELKSAKKRSDVSFLQMSSERDSALAKLESLVEENSTMKERLSSLELLKGGLELKSGEKLNGTDEKKDENEHSAVEKQDLECQGENIAPSPSSCNVDENNENSYESMTVAELRAILKKRGLKVGGKKAELIMRLSSSP